MTTTFELGVRVTAPGELLRRTVSRRTEPTRREWYRTNWSKDVTGIYIGVRTFQNGEMKWIGGEDYGYYVFTADERIKVALIVVGERQRPVPVLFSEMRLV